MCHRLFTSSTLETIGPVKVEAGRTGTCKCGVPLGSNWPHALCTHGARKFAVQLHCKHFQSETSTLSSMTSAATLQRLLWGPALQIHHRVGNDHLMLCISDPCACETFLQHTLRGELLGGRSCGFFALYDSLIMVNNRGKSPTILLDMPTICWFLNRWGHQRIHLF